MADTIDMALRAGTYLGQLGAQLYQIEDNTMRLQGLGNTEYVQAQRAGAYPAVQPLPARAVMFGRTKLMYTIRQEASRQAALQHKMAVLQAFGQFDTEGRSTFRETSIAPTASMTLAGIGIGGIAGALLAAALL
jgi:predicted ArsR family transcriptional regulator